MLKREQGSCKSEKGLTVHARPFSIKFQGCSELLSCDGKLLTIYNGSINPHSHNIEAVVQA